LTLYTLDLNGCFDVASDGYDEGMVRCVNGGMNQNDNAGANVLNRTIDVRPKQGNKSASYSITTAFYGLRSGTSSSGMWPCAREDAHIGHLDPCSTPSSVGHPPRNWVLLP
jgi:hypothetical protein